MEGFARAGAACNHNDFRFVGVDGQRSPRHHNGDYRPAQPDTNAIVISFDRLTVPTQLDILTCGRSL
jgi:hypothetical protein